MLKLSLNKIKFIYIDYYNKLVLNKNLQKKIINDKNKRVLMSFGKKKNANTVTLRAPKHFKVGRHHYHTITKYSTFLLKNFKIISIVPNHTLYSYIILLMCLIKKKKLPKIISLLESIVISIKVKDTFFII